MPRLTPLLCACLALACARPALRSSDEPSRNPSARLARLAGDYWDFVLREDPIEATWLGDRRFDTLLPDASAAAHQHRLEMVGAFAKEVEDVDPAPLSEEERITRSVLLTHLHRTLSTEICHSELWNINPLDGVQTQLGELPSLHTISTEEQARALAERYRHAGTWLQQHMDNLRRGLQRGYLAPRVGVERVIAQLDRMLESREKPADSSFVALAQLPADWSEPQRTAARTALATAATEGLFPALARYRDFLRNDYLAHARPEPGVSANPDGPACYAARIQATVGRALTPEEIHRIGLSEVEKIEAGMKAIALRRVGREDIAALKASLVADPAQHPATREAVLSFNRELLKKVQARLPEVFGHLPKRRLEVKPIEEFREKDAPAGYYYQGDEQGTRPGYYYVNTYNPSERTFFGMQPLAFHEGIPGHHLQGALAQELEGLPAFRRNMGDGAFTEGWAHYAERLADELGLYEGDAGRYGMYSDQSLRAVRLVVDTGLHSLGWSREQAIQYMVDHTAEPRGEAEREIDRYIVWPGQALAYKLGQLEILSLRDEARRRLGDRFELKAFHDAVLGHGALPLPVLREVVTRWMDAQAPR